MAGAGLCCVAVTGPGVVVGPDVTTLFGSAVAGVWDGCAAPGVADGAGAVAEDALTRVGDVGIAPVPLLGVLVPEVGVCAF
ncbi:hypothetical protein GCM10022267_79320 [Lentzea roselyniae]|uniref:Secreted protein n=1 Tax=Lentzea roselyniae TaxID=531940 RepID=A0ABP7CA80_9PSEU